MKNPNFNCLAGKRCGKCHSYGPFYVIGTTSFLLTDFGTESHDDIEFSDLSRARCANCNHHGIWGDFDDRAVKGKKK